jgi:hypothetical protein
LVGNLINRTKKQHKKTTQKIYLFYCMSSEKIERINLVKLKQPNNQPTNQPNKQPTNQPTKQPTNQTIQPNNPTNPQKNEHI